MKHVCIYSWLLFYDQDCSAVCISLCEYQCDLWTPWGVCPVVLVVRETMWRHNSDILHYQWWPGMKCPFSHWTSCWFCPQPVQYLNNCFYILKHEWIWNNFKKRFPENKIFSFPKVSSQLKNVSFWIWFEEFSSFLLEEGEIRICRRSSLNCH